jgi:hypothetical protein
VGKVGTFAPRNWHFSSNGHGGPCKNRGRLADSVTVTYPGHNLERKRKNISPDSGGLQFLRDLDGHIPQVFSVGLRDLSAAGFPPKPNHNTGVSESRPSYKSDYNRHRSKRRRMERSAIEPLSA